MQREWKWLIEIPNAVPNIERLVKKYEHESKNIGLMCYWVPEVEEAELINGREVEWHSKIQVRVL